MVLCRLVPWFAPALASLRGETLAKPVSMAVLRLLGITATHTVIAIMYIGAFSRFTHGAYTPGFYEYQLDRAPDNESTRLVPYVDAALATLALVQATRPYAFLFAVVFQVMGMGLRLQQQKDVARDAALLAATVVALVASFGGGGGQQADKKKTVAASQEPSPPARNLD